MPCPELRAAPLGWVSEPKPQLYQAGVGGEQVALSRTGRKQEARGTAEGHAEGVLRVPRWTSICRTASRVL